MIAFALKAAGLARNLSRPVKKFKKCIAQGKLVQRNADIELHRRPRPIFRDIRDEMPTAPVLKPKIVAVFEFQFRIRCKLNSVSCGEFLLKCQCRYFSGGCCTAWLPGVKGRTVCSKLSKLNWIDSGANSSPSGSGLPECAPDISPSLNADF